MTTTKTRQTPPDWKRWYCHHGCPKSWLHARGLTAHLMEMHGEPHAR